MPWWSKKYGSSSLCAISQTRLRPGKNKKGQKYAVFLKCGHGFCRSLLDKWVAQQVADGVYPSCPCCRKTFIPNGIKVLI